MIEAWRQAVEPLGALAQVKLFLPVFLLALFWCWESWWPFFRQTTGRLRHGWRNVVIALLNTMTLAFTLGMATVVVAAWTQEHQFGLLNLVSLPFVVRLVLAIILLDGWMYVWHRANHAIGLLWRFHRMHHSDPHMDVTTATRFHLGEHVGSAMLRLGLIPLLGFNVWHIVVYETLVLAITQFHHANISIGRWDPWLRLVIVTPFMHKVHHSRRQAETDSNYSTLFSVWDRLGFSFRMRRDMSAIEFGLAEFDEDKWQTIGGMLGTPLATRPRSTSSSIEDSVVEPPGCRLLAKSGDQ